MKSNSKLLRLCVTALMSAACYVAFTFIQFKIPVGDSFTSIHLGNAFNVLAALMLGPIEGGIAGALGMGIGDILDPVYITSAPKTIILKFMIGLVTGSVAHKILHIAKYSDNKKKSMQLAAIASAAGLGFNVIFDPLFSYVYKRFILGNAQAALMLAAFGSLSTVINAVLSIIVATLLYGALCKSFNYDNYH